MSFCRSDKFKSLYKCVLNFEFIRSAKGHQLNIQKHDLLKKMTNYKNENLYYICIIYVYMYIICILYVYYMYSKRKRAFRRANWWGRYVSECWCVSGVVRGWVDRDETRSEHRIAVTVLRMSASSFWLYAMYGSMVGVYRSLWCLRQLISRCAG